MRKNGAFAGETVDPLWTRAMYERYLTHWACDYLVWRKLSGYALGPCPGVIDDDPADEAAADAFAMAAEQC